MLCLGEGNGRTRQKISRQSPRQKVNSKRKAEHTKFDGSNGSSTEEREWWRVFGKDHVRNITSGQIKTGYIYIAKDFVIYVDGDGETVNGFEQKTDSL